MNNINLKLYSRSFDNISQSAFCHFFFAMMTRGKLLARNRTEPFWMATYVTTCLVTSNLF